MAGEFGEQIDETGTLIRDEGGFLFRRDSGGRYRLDLHRTPVDHFQKRVRVVGVGVVVADDVIDVDGVSTA